MNLICKLIMNSLYGRFGMKPIISKQEFVNFDEYKNIAEKYPIVEALPLDNFGFFICYEDRKLLNNNTRSSVGIAAAVTAYSRVYMSKFKIKVYYWCRP